MLGKVGRMGTAVCEDWRKDVGDECCYWVKNGGLSRAFMSCFGLSGVGWVGWARYFAQVCGKGHGTGNELRNGIAFFYLISRI